ncbi:MAG: 16S rRNA (adenine(1518)-N(6)/adenine(1519)-N(6))-dimethyltransferase RsmA [Patescibacteria group bacterium]
MNLLSPTDIKILLAKYNTRPSKGLGQNFLIDKNVLQKIISAADLSKNDIVLEIGPGIGTLTQELAQKAKKVIAIEKDKKMCKILKETLKDFDNIEIINADILKIKELENYLKIKNYKIVANIPYYITSPLIRKFLESPKPPRDFVLMVQKEVAQRICTKPPDMSLLAVSVQFYAEPKIISYVSKNCFWPSPKVDSAIIKIKPQINADKKQINADLFFKIVKAGFSQPRKQLGNNLLALSHSEGSKTLKLTKEQTAMWLVKNGIKPSQRAETLSIYDWKNLANSL